MAWPSWFPTVSRPSNWRDYSAIYRKVLPREWPPGLWRLGSEGLKDLYALAESLAMVRDRLEWVLVAYFPAYDTNGVFLGHWESVFGIAPADTIAERQNRILAYMRALRAAMTAAQLKVTFARAFGSDDPADVSIDSPDPADVTAIETLGEITYVFNNNQLHIYSTGETTEPDFKIADDLVDRLVPSGQIWSVSQYQYAKASYAFASRDCAG
jgi:uncharacterized protein YmfQ (DUF2313 family)